MDNDYKCYVCGGQVIWVGSENTDDIGRDEEDIINYYECQDCGASYEVILYNKEED